LGVAWLLVFQLYWWLKFSQFFCYVIDCFCGNPAGATIGAAHYGFSFDIIFAISLFFKYKNKSIETTIIVTAA
jgi:hypothetical protein